MKREDKATAVAELSERLKESEAIFAIDYRGISVSDSAELRGKLTDADAVFKVVKNRLAKLAAADSGTEGLDDLLVGPTALTLIKGDAVIAAKAIADFAKEHEALEYKGGIMDGAPLEPDAFKQIARLPGVDVLRGQLVGLAASPLTGLAAGLNNLISGLGRQLAQVAEQGLVTGEPPAAEAAPAAAEAPAAEEAPAEPGAEQGEPDPATSGREAEDVEGSDSETSNEDEPEAGEESLAAGTDTETDETPEEVDAEGETSEGDEEA